MNSRRRAPLILLPTLLLTPSSALYAKTPEPVSGKVVAIADSDTLTVLDDANTEHKIRLAGIDAPEMKQPFGTKAREALSSKTFGKRVNIDVITLDRFQRKVGYVCLGGDFSA
jgi:endonuclease YncB( thermonuclease family)